MHVRRSLLLGVCLLACDRPTADSQADKAPAAPAPAATATTSASDEAPPSREDAKQPKQPDAPVVTPEVTNESTEALEARAWTHYRAGEYDAAGAAFAQLAAREPKVWKYPYNAACAAALRQDYATAQLALVDAFLRGGDAARNKAKRDSDLNSLHGRSWWSELLAADEAQLAAWQLHGEESEPEPAPEDGEQSGNDTPILSRLSPYGPGESPIEIRNITAVTEAPRRTSSWRLRASFVADKRKPWTGAARLLATCEADGRYFAANKHLEFGDGLFGVGHSRDYDVQLFSEVFTTDQPEFKRCELRLVHFPTPDADGRLVFESCFDGTKMEAGRCRDFKRVPATKLEARLTSKLTIEENVQAVWAYVELGAGVGPRPSERYHVRYDCRVGDQKLTGNRALLTPGRYDLLAPGEVMQGSVTIKTEGAPDRCELELERTCCDQGQETGVGPYCVTAAGQTPGPCTLD